MISHHRTALGALLLTASSFLARAQDFQSPVVAGLFYPADQAALESVLARFAEQAPPSRVSGKIVALVSPHAGYVYSGQVAAGAYKALKSEKFDAVILIGASHHYGKIGVVVDTRNGHRTPLGTVLYDRATAQALVKRKGIFSSRTEPFTKEHSLEVQLPFLQTLYGNNLRVVEILMTDQDWQTCQTLSQAIVDVIKKKKALIIASSDLSHYHPYQEAVTLDQRLAQRLAQFDAAKFYEDIAGGRCEACGAGPIAVALLSAKMLGADKAQVLAYANSGDVTGDSSAVVGYLTAVMFKQEVGMDLGFTEVEKKLLHSIARRAVEKAARQPQVSAREVLKEFKETPAKLKELYGVFVTIKSHGLLRGCIGRLVADKPICEAAAEMAIAAATQDPRFRPLRKEELASIQIDISVLTPFRKVTSIDEIEVGRDGLLIRRGPNSGVLLPQVAVEQNWNRLTFLEQICYKAGLDKDAWKEKGTEIYSFSAQIIAKTQ